MFDYIRNRLYCPYCGHLIDEQFQTKDFENFLWKLRLKRPVRVNFEEGEARIYGSCKKCKSRVKLVISKSDMRLPTESERLKRNEMMDRGLEKMSRLLAAKGRKA